MGRAVRLTLTWLLALALPLQGVSAATLTACGSIRPGQPTPHGERHLHDGSAAAHRSHLHGVSASAHAHADVDRSARSDADATTHRAHKCSACASCCLGAVVASAAISFEPFRLPDVFASLVARAPAAYVTDGPERPPRPFLA